MQNLPFGYIGRFKLDEYPKPSHCQLKYNVIIKGKHHNQPVTSANQPKKKSMTDLQDKHIQYLNKIGQHKSTKILNQITHIPTSLMHRTKH